eukprot:TRINITY_DN6490_c1_g1_i1.p1 TRINITY_DN6490_c1_g1~~TRINITY_DN6490_c1_g1_i1.p1  ORF type:complete len:275 (-),score=59.25 TRINITY_DN6490_c1_g1_i1:169-993(-)
MELAFDFTLSTGQQLAKPNDSSPKTAEQQCTYFQNATRTIMRLHGGTDFIVGRTFEKADQSYNLKAFGFERRRCILNRVKLLLPKEVGMVFARARIQELDKEARMAYKWIPPFGTRPPIWRPTSTDLRVGKEDPDIANPHYAEARARWIRLKQSGIQLRRMATMAIDPPPMGAADLTEQEKTKIDEAEEGRHRVWTEFIVYQNKTSHYTNAHMAVLDMQARPVLSCLMCDKTEKLPSLKGDPDCCKYLQRGCPKWTKIKRSMDTYITADLTENT